MLYAVQAADLERTEDGKWKFVIASNGLERDRTTEEGRGVHCDENRLKHRGDSLWIRKNVKKLPPNFQNIKIFTSRN